MTSRHRHTVVIFVAAIAISLAVALAAAKTVFTPVTATALQVAPPDRVETNCIGGSPTGIWPPCTPGSKSEIRNWNLVYRVNSQKSDGTPDPYSTGTRYQVFNATLDENGNGHVWGTFRFVLDAGAGEWDGVYTGFTHGWFGALNADAVGHGSQGQVDGMQLKTVVSYERWPVNPSTGSPGLETDTGYRFDPGGGK
jgi:hypothetical protein